MVRKHMILLGSILLPAAVQAQAPAASGQAALADVERFRAAMKVIETSMDTQQLVKAMAVLREAYPRSRPVLVEAVEKGSVKKKAFAIQVLGEHGKAEDDMNVVVPALKDSREKVRLATVMAIRRLGKSGLKPMLEYLPREESANNRKMAIKTLQHWNDPAACPVLVRMLTTEKDEPVRNFIVTALEYMTRKKLGNDAAAWESYLESKTVQEHAELLRAKDGKERSKK